MSGITLRHLRYFEALARHLHFGRAAEACGISQPALSVQMKELEAILGTPLVERGPRTIRLSGLGQELAERARGILRAVEEIDELARVSHGTLSGRLHIGAIPTVAPYLLPGLIKALSEDYPDLDVHPREAITQTLVDNLLDGKLDLAIVALPVSVAALHEEPLLHEEFVLVRPAGDADLPVPSAETLCEMRLLLLEEGHCLRDQALAFCSMSSRGPSEVLEGTSLSTLVQMVGAGIGVTLIPEMALSNETASADVSIARLTHPHSAARTIGMIWRKSTPLQSHLLQISRRLLTLPPCRSWADCVDIPNAPG